MAQIKLKRGPSSNITSINLAKGEPAFTTDTKKLYIGNEDGTKTLINPDITPSAVPVTSVSGRTGDIILTATDVGLGNANNTSDLDKPISTAVQAALDLRELKSNKGVANGYAGLDSTGKVPMSQMNDAILGNLQFQGTWNAASNTPSLPAVPAVKGHYFIVSASGTQFGITFDVGDWLVALDTTWDKVDNTDAVMSVNGKLGNVVLTYADVNAAPLASPGLTGTPTAPTAAAGTKTAQLATTEFVHSQGFLNENSVIDGGTF